jgi:uncharacterized protein (TIGR00369 family)
MGSIEAQRARIAEKLKGQRFMRHLGFEITRIDQGEVEGEMLLAEFALQQMDFVHGGVTATLADIVAGFAAYTCSPLDRNVVTSGLHIQYFAPGYGERLRAVGRVVKAGSRLHYCESEVYAVDTGGERLIARAISTMAVV